MTTRGSILQYDSLAPNEYVHYLPTLRLFFDGGLSNDYRLRGDSVEFRTNEGEWRTLNDSELLIHFRFNTEVARWLRRYSIEANPNIGNAG